MEGALMQSAAVVRAAPIRDAILFMTTPLRLKDAF
jgi:hypothetical protein